MAALYVLFEQFISAYVDVTSSQRMSYHPLADTRMHFNMKPDCTQNKYRTGKQLRNI